MSLIRALRLAACAAALASPFCSWASSPALRSPSWAALDEGGRLIAGSGADTARPIASITKLMMAMAYLDSKPDLSLAETISKADIDTLKMSSSRLPVGAAMRRSDLLRLALASSENRAASALARGYPGGTVAMVAAMNFKAQSLGLFKARFVDPTGLSPMNIASAREVAQMALAARGYAQAREAAKLSEYAQAISTVQGEALELGYKNTNKPLRDGLIAPLVSKTGYIKEAGRCLGWALGLSNGQAVGLALLGSKSFAQRDADEIALSSWASVAALKERGDATGIHSARAPKASKKRLRER